MRNLIVQNNALEYLKSRIAKVHEYAPALVRVSMMNLRLGKLDGVPLDAKTVELLRFHAAWNAAPTELHQPDPRWESLAGDFQHCFENGLEVYIAVEKWRLSPRWKVWARDFLTFRFAYYVEPAADAEPEEVHIFLMRASRSE